MALKIVRTESALSSLELGSSSLPIIVFGVIGPLPINDRVKAWDISSLSEDWQAQRGRRRAITTKRETVHQPPLGCIRNHRG
jgi:hypothetical protein